VLPRLPGRDKGAQLQRLGRVPLVSADFWTSDRPSECFFRNARAQNAHV
jgi:hypothetical protein